MRLTSRSQLSVLVGALAVVVIFSSLRSFLLDSSSLMSKIVSVGSAILCIILYWYVRQEQVSNNDNALANPPD